MAYIASFRTPMVHSEICLLKKNQIKKKIEWHKAKYQFYKGSNGFHGFMFGSERIFAQKCTGFAILQYLSHSVRDKLASRVWRDIVGL